MVLILLIILLTELKPEAVVDAFKSHVVPSGWAHGRNEWLNSFQVLTKKQIGGSSFRRGSYKSILHFNDE